MLFRELARNCGMRYQLIFVIYLDINLRRKSLLFEVLESDDSYYDLDGIISKVKKRTS